MTQIGLLFRICDFYYDCNHRFHLLFFLNKKLEDISPFCGATDTPFWTSGDISSEFQSHSGQPYLCLAEAHTCVTSALRLTSGVPTVLVGLETGTYGAADKRSTN